MLWNVPGLEIVLPSSPRDVKGLLKTAVSTDNPTIFVDHVKLLDVRGDVDQDQKPIPFGVADIKRRGGDVTVVATSYAVQSCLKVADRLAKENIEVEVIDLAPGETRLVLAEIQANHYGKHAGWVAATAGKSDTVRAELSTTVYP